MDSEKIKPQEIHMGVSALRQMCSTTLKAQKNVIILHDRAEPIAVMIPYSLYMAVQEMREALERCRENRFEGDKIMCIVDGVLHG